eukprot:1638318-Lingulodinium_polyedra.AAC.1
MLVRAAAARVGPRAHVLYLREGPVLAPAGGWGPRYTRPPARPSPCNGTTCRATHHAPPWPWCAAGT